MRKSARILASIVIALFLLTAGATAQHEPAQHPAASEPKQAEPQKEAKPGEHKAEGPEAELAHKSHEAAGEEEEENAEFKHSPSVQWLAKITGLSLAGAYWLAMAVNFLVIAAAIVWFSKSSLPQMFRNRTQSIKKTLEEARNSSEDATKRLGQIESRLAKLDGEIASMRATAEAEAAEEEKRIRAAAEEDRRKIVETTEQEIKAAVRLAERELKAYAAELAVSLAERRIQVDPTTDRALVESFVAQLGDGTGKGDK